MSTGPVAREPLHRRRIELDFYRRADGLYEVEGRLLDTKCHAFRRQLADVDTPPGTPLHDITVRLVVDEAQVVQQAAATMATTPFGICRGAEQTLPALVGLQIGAGWNKRVRALLVGAASCTHIVELLGPMATTVQQGLAPQRLALFNDPVQGEALRRGRVDSCFAYAAEREVVAALWPHLRRPQPGDIV